MSIKKKWQQYKKGKALVQNIRAFLLYHGSELGLEDCRCRIAKLVNDSKADQKFKDCVTAHTNKSLAFNAKDL